MLKQLYATAAASLLILSMAGCGSQGSQTLPNITTNSTASNSGSAAIASARPGATPCTNVGTVGSSAAHRMDCGPCETSNLTVCSTSSSDFTDDTGSDGGSDTGCTPVEIVHPRTIASKRATGSAHAACTDTGGGGGGTGTTTRAAQIFANATALLGTQTKAIAKKLHGTACGYMVNQAVSPVVGITLSNWVPDAVTEMDQDQTDFTKLQDNTEAVEGDIVVKDGSDYADANDPYSPAQSHIGICANNGCTQIYCRDIRCHAKNCARCPLPGNGNAHGHKLSATDPAEDSDAGSGYADAGPHSSANGTADASSNAHAGLSKRRGQYPGSNLGWSQCIVSRSGELHDGRLFLGQLRIGKLDKWRNGRRDRVPLLEWGLDTGIRRRRHADPNDSDGAWGGRHRRD